MRFFVVAKLTIVGLTHHVLLDLLLVGVAEAVLDERPTQLISLLFSNHDLTLGNFDSSHVFALKILGCV